MISRQVYFGVGASLQPSVGCRLICCEFYPRGLYPYEVNTYEEFNHGTVKPIGLRGFRLFFVTRTTYRYFLQCLNLDLSNTKTHEKTS